MRDLREVQEELALVRGLVKHSAWKQLMDIAAKQLTTRTDNVILVPVAGADACYGQEFMKGEIAGIRLFMNLPRILEEQLEDELKTLTKETTDE